MKKFLSILALLTASMFVGGVAHATTVDAPNAICITDPSVCVTAEDGSLVDPGFYSDTETTTDTTYPDQASCEAAGFIWAGDFCYTRKANNPEWLPEDCPRLPTGECYSEAVPAPEHTVAPTPEPIPFVVPEAAQTGVSPVTTEPAYPSTQPVERTELAYTGAEDVLLATVGAAVTLAGVVLVRQSLKMRRKAAGYSV